jgi:hypothetical protein
VKRIRALGLGVLMALALTVIPASASASGGFAAEQYPATLDGGEFSFPLWFMQGNSSLAVQCYMKRAEGTLKGPSEAISISNVSCAELKMNGCKMELLPGSKSFSIGPPGCGPITLVAPGSCYFSIGAQTGLAATYTNSGSGSKAGVSINLDSGYKVKYTITNGFGCGGTKGSSYENLRIVADPWVQTAKNAAKAAIGLSTYSGEPSVGIFSKWTYPAEQSKILDAQAFPVHVTGVWAGKSAFEFNTYNTIEGCKEGQYDAGEFAEAVGPEAGFGVGASYKGCVGLGQTFSVNMNSCKYKIWGFPFQGKNQVAIACSTKGDSIELVSSVCTVKLPEQWLGLQSVTNVGQGNSATMEVNLSSSTVQYTNENSFICSLAGLEGSGGTKGILKASFILKGTYTG